MPDRDPNEKGAPSGYTCIVNRRLFIATSAGAALAASNPLSAAPALAARPASAHFIKSICSRIFPDRMPEPEKFRQAKNAGFDGIEVRFGGEISPSLSADEVKRIGDAVHEAGVQIASMWVAEPFQTSPLNSPDAAVRARGLDALRKAIEFATYLNCGALLLYPCRLGSGPKFQYGYEDTWNRVSAELRKALPWAQQAKVILTPENVWSKFLVSPLEMRAFVDQFHSPWLQTHFDIGNVMQYGYPQDWILTLGPRIKRVHVKDYKLSTRDEQGRFCDLLEGDVDWKEVMAAFVKVGYHGFLSPEIGYDPDNPDKLRQVSEALDKILAMA
jgi:L-ribulose-5-phosphate 3-epimerase